MRLDLSRRQFAKMIAGSAAGVAIGQLGRSAVSAAPIAGYKAMVGIFLFGGNDGFNMVVPTDGRYATYQTLRGGIGLPANTLVPLQDVAYGFHPSLAPLQQVWADGALNVVLNTGTLQAPFANRADFLSRKDLWPANMMSHTDEQYHWQGLRAQGANTDGFMGRIVDRSPDTALPSLISFGGADLILSGAKGQLLTMQSSGIVAKADLTANAADPAIFARKAAVAALADGTGYGATTRTIGGLVTDGYTQSAIANGVLSATNSVVDKFFVNAGGNTLTSDISRQLLRTARMIEAHATLGHPRQTFFASQGNYDTHAYQSSTQTNLLLDLAEAMAAFRKAMVALGLDENVTCFTMSDFGRTYKPNGGGGSEHGWGNNHLVMGGALKPRQMVGAYPTLEFGGDDDADIDGRWIPRIASDEYISAIARWHGVADADLPYVFPNWATWSATGRGSIPLFRS